MNLTSDHEDVEAILEAEFPGRVYTVEDRTVWVSGANSACPSLARRMARTLTRHDIPCGLVYDDDAVRFGGVQFNWGESA